MCAVKLIKLSQFKEICKNKIIKHKKFMDLPRKYA